MTETPEPTAEQVTLATIRQSVERTIEILAHAEPGSYGAGRHAEARDILAICNMNGRPAHEPVIFPAAGE